MKGFLKFGLHAMIVSVGFLFIGCTGEDGEPGVGLDETIKYGNMVVTFTGTRPDGVAFTKTADLKYATAGVDAGYWTQDSETGPKSFVIGRTINPTSSEGVWLHFDVAADGVVRMTYSYTLMRLLFDDNKFFTLSYQTVSFDNVTVSDYAFNAATGALKMKCSFDVPDRTDDLKVSVDVNVTTYHKLF